MLAPILRPKSSKPSSPTSVVAADTRDCLFDYHKRLGIEFHINCARAGWKRIIGVLVDLISSCRPIVPFIKTPSSAVPDLIQRN